MSLKVVTAVFPLNDIFFETPCRYVALYLDPGARLGGHPLAVLGVYARPGQAETARHLGVAVLGREVERLQGRGYNRYCTKDT